MLAGSVVQYNPGREFEVTTSAFFSNQGWSCCHRSSGMKEIWLLMPAASRIKSTRCLCANMYRYLTCRQKPKASMTALASGNFGDMGFLRVLISFSLVNVSKARILYGTIFVWNSNVIDGLSQQLKINYLDANTIEIYVWGNISRCYLKVTWAIIPT